MHCLLKQRAEIKRNGNIYRQSYRRGEKTGELEIIGKSEKNGTKITFKADPEIFTETTTYNYETS